MYWTVKYIADKAERGINVKLLVKIENKTSKAGNPYKSCVLVARTDESLDIVLTYDETTIANVLGIAPIYVRNMDCGVYDLTDKKHERSDGK